MPDLEARLRTALHAVDPDGMSDDDAWLTLSVQLGVGSEPHGDGCGAAEPSTFDRELDVTGAAGHLADARRRRRLALAIGLAAAIASGGLLATSPFRQSANGPATAPSGGIPRLVLDHPPAGMVPIEAHDHNFGGTGAVYTIGLRSTGGARASVQISAGLGTGAIPVGDPITIDGHPGTMRPGLHEMTQLAWNDGTVTYDLLALGPQTTAPGFALALAGSVRRTGTVAMSPPPITLSRVPDGFAVTYEGNDAALYPSGGYLVHYRTPDNLPVDAAPDLILHVWPRGLGAERLATVLGLDPVTVAGRQTYVGPVGYYASAGLEHADSVMAVFDLDGAVVRADASYLGHAQFLDALAQLRLVSDADWRRLVLDRAVGSGPGPGPIDVVGPRTTPSTAPPAPPVRSMGEVPNVIGLEATVAANLLGSSGFTVTMATEVSDTVPAGTEIRTDPPPATAPSARGHGRARRVRRACSRGGPRRHGDAVRRRRGQGSGGASCSDGADRLRDGRCSPGSCRQPVPGSRHHDDADERRHVLPGAAAPCCEHPVVARSHACRPVNVPRDSV